MAFFKICIIMLVFNIYVVLIYLCYYVLMDILFVVIMLCYYVNVIIRTNNAGF